MNLRAFLLVLLLALAAPVLAAEAPAGFLVVEGGPEDGLLWRGWPLLVQVVGAPETSAKLEVKGPSPLAPRRGGQVWAMSAGETAALKPGAYRFTVSGLSAEAKLADPPATVSEEQRRVLRRLQVYSALALGDPEAAKRVGAQWTQEEDSSVEAYAAYADALAASGDRAGAVGAWRHALARIPQGVCPPSSLTDRARELLFGEP